MSIPLGRNAHDRILARVAERTGLPESECRFMVSAMWKAMRYYLYRPWLIPPGIAFFVGTKLRFVLNVNLMLRHAFWNPLDAYGNETIFTVLDRLLLKSPPRSYIRKRNSRFAYYEQKLKDGYVNGPPKPKKELLAYMFITKEVARQIAREVASKKLTTQ